MVLYMQDGLDAYVSYMYSYVEPILLTHICVFSSVGVKYREVMQFGFGAILFPSQETSITTFQVAIEIKSVCWMKFGA